MDIEFLSEYAIPVIIGICLCLGYVIKTSVPIIDNRKIPLIMATIGVLLNIWINRTMNPNIMLGGLFSGLCSTGLHQLFVKTFIDKGEK